jgi:hypothetical protein
MSRSGDISNKRQNKKEEPSKELSPWLERLAERLKPFTARSTVPASMPPLSSYSRQKLGHAGEAGSRLATWVTEHSRLASVLSRAIHMPLLSRALDSIWRKPTFVPSVWPRMLDLPWFRQSQESRQGFTEAKATAVDGRLTNTVGRRNAPYPNTLVQTTRGAEEGRLSAEVVETYPLPTVDGHLPRTASISTSPVQKKDTAATRNSNELNQGLGINRQVPPVHPADEAYPAVIQDLLPPPVAGGRMSDIARAPFITLTTRQETVVPEARDAGGFTLSRARRGRTSIPDLHKPSDIQEPEPRQVMGAREKIAGVYRQPYHIHSDRSLPQSLTPMTRPVVRQRKTLEAHRQDTTERIRESPASPIRDFYYPKATDREGGESVSFMAGKAALPLIANITDAPEGPGQPPTMATATRLDEPESNSLPTREVTPAEVPRGLPYGVAPQLAPDISQTWTGKPVISRPAKRVSEEAEVTQKPEQGVPNLVTGVRSSVDRGLEGYAEKRFLYKGTPATAGSVIQRQPIIKSISRKITLPYQRLFKSGTDVHPSDKSKSGGLLVNRENVPSSKGYDYARQPVLPLPVSPPQPPAAIRASHSEGLLRQASYTVQELTYSRNNGTSTSGVIQRAPESTTSAAEASERPEVTASQLGGEEIREPGAAPDLRALAREIYPFIKRMIMVERERRPT